MPMASLLENARSLLFVPGDRPDRFSKAVASGADLVVLDLEDAVLPNHKAAARDNVTRALVADTYMVRINSRGTVWHEEDLRALAGLEHCAGVMLAKAESASDIAEIRALLPVTVPICALVETVAGLFGIRAMLSGGGVARIAFGALDFALETGIEDDGQLDVCRAQLVMESVSAGIPAPIDGVMTVLDDPDRLSLAVSQSRRRGMGGKLCIHPRQIDIVNRGFLPDEAMIAWAQQVMAAAAGAGAVVVHGAMVDRPVVEKARRILAQAKAAPVN